MLSIEAVSKALKSYKLLTVKQELSSVGVSITYNTLNKIRQGDRSVQYKSLEIASNYVEGVYDDEIQSKK